jgi:hypothetical protein
MNRDRIDELEEVLWCIAQWIDAYPLHVFPEPDLVRHVVADDLIDAVLDDLPASSCIRRVCRITDRGVEFDLTSTEALVVRPFHR